MSKRVWSVGLAGAVLVVASVASPVYATAQASDPASMDALKASDAELTKALADLDAQVAQQEIAVAAAQQSLDAANQALADDDAALQETAARLEALKGVAAQRAVEEYMAPHDLMQAVLGADGLEDAGRRSVLLEQLSGRDLQTVEDLKAARSDLDRQRTAVLEAQRVAADRRAVEGTKLDQLNAARADKANLEQSLHDRMESYAAEDAAGAASAGGATGSRASRGGGGVDDGRISAAGLKWPVIGPIRSPFGPRWGTMHTGIDIGATEGTPIYAAKSGNVISAGFDGGGYGNLVKVDNGSGLQTWYAHQSRINVSAGQTVNQGDLIGWVGHTGHVVPNNAGAAHLHFETRINNVPRDPMQFLP